MEQRHRREQHDHPPVAEQGARSGTGPRTGRVPLLQIEPPDQERARGRQHGDDRHRVEHRGRPEPRGGRHRGECGGDVTRVVVALVLAHHLVQRRVPREPQRQGAQEGHEERLGRAAQEHERADRPPGRGHERERAETQPDRERRRGEQQSVMAHAVRDDPGRGLGEKDAQTAGGRGELDRVVAPPALREQLRQERHHDAGQFGQEKVRRVQPDAVPGRERFGGRGRGRIGDREWGTHGKCSVSRNRPAGGPVGPGVGLPVRRHFTAGGRGGAPLPFGSGAGGGFAAPSHSARSRCSLTRSQASAARASSAALR